MKEVYCDLCREQTSYKNNVDVFPKDEKKNLITKDVCFNCLTDKPVLRLIAQFEEKLNIPILALTVAKPELKE